MFPNHGVISKGLLGIGEDEDALYCVTDDTICCGTPPSPDCCGTSDPYITLSGYGGVGNGEETGTSRMVIYCHLQLILLENSVGMRDG